MWHSIEPEERLSWIYYARSLNNDDKLLQNLSLLFEATHMLIVSQYFNGIVKYFAVKALVKYGCNSRVL